ncbi:hypothetical protein PC111_g12180 [Phytophthora cactorum]|nr:hypothetical protein PC111_g12180 [Phytophthora cactorum]
MATSAVDEEQRMARRGSLQWYAEGDPSENQTTTTSDGEVSGCTWIWPAMGEKEPDHHNGNTKRMDRLPGAVTRHNNGPNQAVETTDEETLVVVMISWMASGDGV